MRDEFCSATQPPIRYRLFPLTPDRLDAALALCRDSVGENMYGRGELEAAIDSPNRFFYLAATEDGEVVGYIYFYPESAEALPVYGKLEPACRETAGLRAGTPIGNLQSIGVREEHRRTGLSLYLMRFAMDKLAREGAEVWLGVCWKVGDTIPMKRIMEDLGFRFLCDIERFWYDIPALVCPCCGGRCECGAAVYHQPVHKERTP